MNGPACGRTVEGCEEVSSVTYPKLIGEIDASMSTISTGIKEISSTLGSLSVPNDYLGTKVQRELGNLTGFFDEDANLVVNENKSIDAFVKGKIAEHNKHRAEYLAYLAEQRRKALLKKKKQEDEGIVAELS